VRRRVLCTPRMNSCLCVKWILVSEVCVSEVCFLCNERSAPSASARASEEDAVFSGVVDWGVFDVVVVGTVFEVGVAEGCGVTSWQSYECV
jgi:hypothetical protein